MQVSVSLMVTVPSQVLGDLLGQGPCPSVVEMDFSLVNFFFFNEYQKLITNYLRFKH